MASQASSRGGWLASVACFDVRHRTHILCMHLLSGCRCEANILLNAPTVSSSAYQSVPSGGYALGNKGLPKASNVYLVSSHFSDKNYRSVSDPMADKIIARIRMSIQKN